MPETTDLPPPIFHQDSTLDLSKSAWATLLGLTAAVGYTLANIALRSVSDCDPVWVSCIKAIPTLVIATPIVWWIQRGRHPLPAPRVIAALVVASLVGHLFGNVVFQWALGVIGIALTVPVTLGSIIVFGTLMGGLLMNEPVTRRTLTAVVMLTIAVFVLSLGADDAYQSVTQSVDAPWWLVAAGVGGAVMCGASYAFLGAVIRYGVQRRVSVMFTLFVVSLVGSTSLGALSLLRGGIDVMASYSAAQYGTMFLAGLANAAAFLALTAAYKLAHMVYVNALNASQAAMAAVAGIILFHEAPTPALWLGLGMTVLGLGYLDRHG